MNWQPNYYGWLVMLGLLVGLYLINYRRQRWLINHPNDAAVLDSPHFYSLINWIILGGIVGARLWHVVTDWQIYFNDWAAIPQVWQGGLSIRGAWLGGLIIFGVRFWRHDHRHRIWLDLAIFGLPAAQAIGRIGNWFNQELYGWPTNLPWAIFIDTEHRLPGLVTFEQFHPLFAYEALVLILAQLLIWRQWGNRDQNLGSGWLLTGYLVFYGLLRFGLDFLRPGKATITLVTWQLGWNQVAILIWLPLLVMLMSATYFYSRKYENKSVK